MDPALLKDPAFWENPDPVAAGGFPGELPNLPDLRNHILFETSGTSGEPKWIALSKSALLISAAAVNRHLNVTGASCWGLALPAFHVGGFGVIARAFESASGLEVFSGKWNPERFANWVTERQVTHTSLVPAQVYDLVSTGALAPKLVAAVVVGGGHLDDRTGNAARELGWPVLASYGMTEAASQIATQALYQLDESYQSAPIPLLPIWKAGVGREGNFHISGPSLFSGTLIRRRNGWDFQPREGECHITADRVSLDGIWLTPLGRTDTLVKVLGELVDPEEIERQLVKLSGGRLRAGAFAVAALPDARAGHRMVAVAGPSADPVHFARACEAYQMQAAGHQRIAETVRVARLPMNSMGKIRRGELAAMVGT